MEILLIFVAIGIYGSIGLTFSRVWEELAIFWPLILLILVFAWMVKKAYSAMKKDLDP